MLSALAILFASGVASGAQLTVSWVDNSNGLAATKLERRQGADTVFTTIADIAPGPTSYVDTKVNSGGTYCYRVRAYRGSEVSPYSAEACGTARDDGLRLSVSKHGAGTGTVVSTPAGINCGRACSATYPAGTSVTLAATPGSGSSFSGWGGACAGTAACAVAGNALVAVTAKFSTTAVSAGFSEESHLFTVTKSGRGTVTSTPAGISCGSVCSRNYIVGTLVTLVATSAPGHVFAGWTGACTGAGRCTVTIDGAATTVAAAFLPALSARCALPAGEVGLAYGASCTIAGGLPPYSCSLASGRMPSGLTLDRDCHVRGTAAAAGTGAFTARVSDAAGLMRIARGTLTIVPPVRITTAALQQATIDRALVRTLVAAGGRRPYSWTVTTGALPTGVTMDAALGRIKGLPTSIGISRFTVRVRDTLGKTTERALELVVNLGPLGATCTLKPGDVGIHYSGSCQPRGGLPPYTCMLANGAMPAGLALNSHCTITGTPTTPGTFIFKTRVVDNGNAMATLNAALTVRPR